MPAQTSGQHYSLATLFKHDSLKFHVKRPGENKILSHGERSPATIISMPAKSPSQLMRFKHLTPTIFSLLIPSYCWTSHAGFGGLWCLSGAPRHMLKELALLVAECLYVTCGQKVRLRLWCSARMDE